MNRKKVGRIIGYFVSILLLCWMIFVVSDVLRLKSLRGKDFYTPIITLDSSETENRRKFVGLGYSINYYVDSGKEIYGFEMRIFDMLIYAQVE